LLGYTELADIKTPRLGTVAARLEHTIKLLFYSGRIGFGNALAHDTKPRRSLPEIGSEVEADPSINLMTGSAPHAAEGESEMELALTASCDSGSMWGTVNGVPQSVQKVYLGSLIAPH
jgi:hypothetical protein